MKRSEYCAYCGNPLLGGFCNEPHCFVNKNKRQKTPSCLVVLATLLSISGTICGLILVGFIRTFQW